jgi:LPS-assembly lipoprotein
MRTVRPVEATKGLIGSLLRPGADRHPVGPVLPSIRLCVLCVVTLLAGCGFQLREARPIPFRALYVSVAQPSPVAIDVRRVLSAPENKLAANLAEAEAHLRFIREDREKVIFSLSGAGRVREYQLRLRVQYQLQDRREADLIAPTEILLTRIVSHDERAITPKEQEELFLYRDMQAEAVNQILRRIARAGQVNP